MALWGKGDPRWIVEERPDSTNVNNWHWTERDGTTWSKEKLKSLFLAIKNENSEGDSWFIDEIKSCDGEATINNRKGKLIFFYEWVISMKYKGKVNGSDVNHTGTIKIPNLSDENSADDVDVEVHAQNDSKNSDKLKGLVRKEGIPMIKKACSDYIQMLRSEYSSGMVLPTKNNVNTNPNGVPVENKMKQKMNELSVNENKSTKNTNRHVQITLQEEFRTSAEDLYETLTNSQRLSAFTRSQCESDLKEGGKFSLMNGNIYGTYEKLEPGKKIIQSWKFKDWPSDVFSHVTIELVQKESSTLIKLSQKGVPDYDMRKTEEGWKQHLWGPMKQVFGYGTQLF